MDANASLKSQSPWRSSHLQWLKMSLTQWRPTSHQRWVRSSSSCLETWRTVVMYTECWSDQGVTGTLIRVSRKFWKEHIPQYQWRGCFFWRFHSLFTKKSNSYSSPWEYWVAKLSIQSYSTQLRLSYLPNLTITKCSVRWEDGCDSKGCVLY